MDELYSDDYARGDGIAANRIFPPVLRRGVSAVVFLALVGTMGVWAYRLGTRDAMDVPIVRAMQGPARVAPEDPGGYQAAHQGREINKVLEGRPVPVPRQTVLLEAAPPLSDEDRPKSELAVASQSKAVAEMVERAALQGPSAELEAEEAIALVKPAPDLSAPDLSADAEDMAGPDAEAAEVEAIVEEEIETAAVSGPRPFSRPANLVRISAPAKTEQVAVRKPAPPAPPAPAPAAASTAREVSSVSAGSRMVQLGAFDSEANTRAAWNQLVAANGDLLRSKSLYVERATNNARVFYRLRVAGFENTDQTRQMCESLRARSIDCIPVTVR